MFNLFGPLNPAGRKKRDVMLCLILLALFVVPAFVNSAGEPGIRIAWDETTTDSDGSPCTDLAGYKVHYKQDTQGGPPYAGTGLDQGDSPIAVPLSSLSDPANPEFYLTGVSPGTYYLVVTAYDTSANESGFSNEVGVPILSLDVTPPANPHNATSEIVVIVP